MNPLSNAPPIERSRTFASVRDLRDDSEDWGGYFGSGKGELTWKDIRDKPLAVVPGEAGIGKTIELELEVQRLRSTGIPGGAKRQPFLELVEYLQAQASIIKTESPGVDALQDIGINCVA